MVSKPRADAVTRPAHYTSATIEPIQVIESWDLNFNLGNVIKYVARAGKKRHSTRLEDLRKAMQYLYFEIERWERRENNSHHSGAEQATNVPVRGHADAADAPGGKES